MKISILTLFPQMFQGPFDYSIVSRAKQDQFVEINFIDIREFGIGKHKIVDDKPYGGGIGMILRADVLKSALDKTKDKKLNNDEEKIILLSAKGSIYNQNKAKEYSRLKHLIIICGHYEGVDERITSFIDEEISIGEYVLTGGEIPAMLITDSIVRLISGVLKEGATQAESYSDKDILEHPQYTRPQVIGEMEVPSVLLSGNHKEINKWKKEKLTKKKS